MGVIITNLGITYNKIGEYYNKIGEYYNKIGEIITIQKKCYICIFRPLKLRLLAQKNESKTRRTEDDKTNQKIK